MLVEDCEGNQDALTRLMYAVKDAAFNIVNKSQGHYGKIHDARPSSSAIGNRTSISENIYAAWKFAAGILNCDMATERELQETTDQPEPDAETLRIAERRRTRGQHCTGTMKGGMGDLKLRINCFQKQTNCEGKWMTTRIKKNRDIHKVFAPPWYWDTTAVMGRYYTEDRLKVKTAEQGIYEHTSMNPKRTQLTAFM